MKSAQFPRLRLSPSLLSLLLLCAGESALAQVPVQAPQAPLPMVELRAGGQPIHAELARTPEQMQTGLMGRHSLRPDSGMLFSFGSPTPVCMWMKDTLLPLSVAFIDAQGRVIGVADMQPLTLQTHCAPQPVAYALEMAQGWFALHRIGPGARLRGGPFGVEPRR